MKKDEYKYKIEREGKIVKEGKIRESGQLGEKGFLWRLIAKVFDQEKEVPKK